MKKYLKFIVLLAASIAVLILFEVNAPRKINWNPSFSREDKIPFGGYVLYNIIPDLFPGKEITPAYYSIYDTFRNASTQRINYIFICDHFNIDKYDYKTLMSLVKNGSYAFIAAHSFSGEIAKKLKVKTSYGLNTGKQVKLKLLNKRLTNKYFSYKQHLAAYYFSSVPKKSTVLGITKNRYVTYVKVRYGKGALLLSSVPYAYTNYYILKKTNWKYVSDTLSYLPVRRTWWDESYKPHKEQGGALLRVVMSQKSFAWAYYLAITTVLLFIIIKGRRKQRIIPVIRPLPNDTVEFVSTVGRLYYEQKDHRNIAEKRITYLFDYIKAKCAIDASRVKPKEYKKLADKCGVSVEKVENLFPLINEIMNQAAISEKRLLELNTLIEDFYLDIKK